MLLTSNTHVVGTVTAVGRSSIGVLIAIIVLLLVSFAIFVVRMFTNVTTDCYKLIFILLCHRSVTGL